MQGASCKGHLETILRVTEACKACQLRRLLDSSLKMHQGCKSEAPH